MRGEPARVCMHCHETVTVSMMKWHLMDTGGQPGPWSCLVLFEAREGRKPELVTVTA